MFCPSLLLMVVESVHHTDVTCQYTLTHLGCLCVTASCQCPPRQVLRPPCHYYSLTSLTGCPPPRVKLD